MSFKFKALGLASALLMTGCGSGDNAVEDHDGVPFVDFTVNGESYPTEVTVARFHQNYDEDARINDNGTPDDPDDDFKESVFCDPTIYANGSDISGDDTTPGIAEDYCRNERNEMLVQFQARLFNNTYDDFELSYTGLGFTVRIFELDGDTVGDEVWHSDYEIQKGIEASKVSSGIELDDYEPTAETITLGAMGVFPGVRLTGTQRGYVVNFLGRRNLIAGGTPDAPESFSASNLYHWPPKTGEESNCSWGLVPYQVPDPVEEGVTYPRYDKVVCDGLPLLPFPSDDILDNYSDSNIYSQIPGEEGYIKFIARVEFNFNNGEFQSPEDIVITITPPPED